MEVTKNKEQEAQGQEGKKPEIDPAVIEELMVSVLLTTRRALAAVSPIDFDWAKRPESALGFG